MKRKTLSNKEKRELNNLIEKYNFQFDKKYIVEIIEDVKHKVVKSNNEVLFFYIGDEIYPSLKFALNQEIALKKITVDMGAVKFVVNGADIMRPGIVEIEEGIESGEIVVIVDINNKKPLAIGRAMYGFVELGSKDSGKVIENLHFIGDEIWNMR